MYDINLIRKTIVPERHRQVLFSVVSFSVLAFVLTGLAVSFFSMANLRVIDVYAKELRNLEENLSLLYPGTPTHEELSVVFARTQPDLKEMSSGIGRRMEMTALWEGIAAAVPDSVWLTSVSLKAPEQAKGSKGTRDGGIVIEGMAVTANGRSGSALIRNFAKIIQSDDALGKHVSDAKFVETGISKVGGTEVIGFEITCALE